MPIRKHLPENSVFHIFSKSIAGYKIFTDEKDFDRFLLMMQFFAIDKTPISFSNLMRSSNSAIQQKIKWWLEQNPSKISLIAYCLMPTHIHLAVYQKEAGALSKFMKKLLSSYTHYFNLKHHRKGPLWESRFKHVQCESDEQLLHLTRYIHLNPVTAYLIEKPEDWHASSYMEYVHPENKGFCQFETLIGVSGANYKSFIENRIEDQRTLACLKKIVLD